MAEHKIHALVATFMKPLVLVAQSHPEVSKLVTSHLAAADFRILTAKDGKGIMRLAQTWKPSLLILDLTLKKGGGLDALRALQREDETRDLPVMMLTPQASDVDRIVAFEMGVEDFVTEPFNPRELILRVKAILRRVLLNGNGRRVVNASKANGRAPITQAPNSPLVLPVSENGELATALRVGELELDRVTREVRIKGRTIETCFIEFRLLEYLMELKGAVADRKTLARDVWDRGEDGLKSRIIETTVYRLRSKLGADAEYVKSVRKLGYRVVDASRASGSN